MTYKILKAELEFDEDGELSRIISTAVSDVDVRKIEARRSNVYWAQYFPEWNESFQDILQNVTAHGSEI